MNRFLTTLLVLASPNAIAIASSHSLPLPSVSLRRLQGNEGVGFGDGTADEALDATVMDGVVDLDGNATTWIDLIGDNPTFFDVDIEGHLSSAACTLLAQAANLSEELRAEGSCKCGYDETTGVLELSCGFADYCGSGESEDESESEDVSEDVSEDESEDGHEDEELEDEDAFMDEAVARNANPTANTGGLPPLCGSASMKLTYASLTEIQADVCIQYSKFPETCYSYGIPFADFGSLPGGIDLTLGNNIDMPSPLVRDCSARYGGDNNNCKCTIDENSCLKVDCTDFEPLAITENCQVVDLAGVDNTSKVVLNFKVPGEGDVVSDGNGGEFIALMSLEQFSGSSSNIAGNSGMAVAAMATTIGILVAGQLLW
jgi:hypothetical protein